jgi:hypothetical protein
MKRKIILFSILFLLLALLAQSASAMSSPAYRIDWNNLLSGGGRLSSSASYQVDLTVGQTASRTSSTSQYQIQLGYWAGLVQSPIFIPSVKKLP